MGGGSGRGEWEERVGGGRIEGGGGGRKERGGRIEGKKRERERL